jgi:Tol biopolymer transport system component
VPTPARFQNWLPIVLGAVLVVAVAVGVWFWWHSEPNKRPDRSLTRLTTNGSSFRPAISPDGKMIAYSAMISGSVNPEIWIQQVGGGKAIQVTHTPPPDGAYHPVFSPEGTYIAFDAGAIFEIPTLGGVPRMVTSQTGWTPKYSGDGSSILFLLSSLRAVPRAGGTPTEVQPEFTATSRPVLSPDGKQVLILGFRKGRQEQDLKGWWLISIADGKLQEIAPPAALPNQSQPSLPEAWITLSPDSTRQWVIFSRPTGDAQNYFRAAISSDGRISSSVEQITFTAASTFGASVSGTGRMVFDSGTISTNLWSIPIDTNQGRITGERQRLTQVEGVRDQGPSLSRDGQKVVFESAGHVVLRDLTAGLERQLEDTRVLADTGLPAISPDGLFVVYTVIEGQAVSLYSVSTSGGTPRRVCRECSSIGALGFSSDGSMALGQKWVEDSSLDRIELINISTGEVKEVLSHPKHSLWHPRFSWDDRWMTFKMELDSIHFRLYITPAENFVPAGENRWIALTTGEHNDDKPQLSPDGNTLYFTSNRDRYHCFWAQRLNPKSKRPIGAPFAIHHIHNLQSLPDAVSPLFSMELNVARDKIVTNLDEFHSDIWMMQLEPGK